MALAKIPAGSVDALVAYLLDGPPSDPLGSEVARWLADSPRFRAFAHAHRDKIRKKLRGAAGGEARRDIRVELRVAFLLQEDRRLALSFEPHGALRGGPDFTVTFAGERPFNLEVTRLHGASAGSSHGGPLLAKLLQLPPSVPNTLLVAVRNEGPESFDAATAVRGLLARAEAKDEAFFTARGFAGIRNFHQYYLRLGAVLVWRESDARGSRVTRWDNRSARIAVPERALRACSACLESQLTP